MEFQHEDLFQIGTDSTRYRLLTRDGVSVSKLDGQEVLRIAPEALTLLAAEAFRDVNFLLRPAHHEMVAQILSDPDASENDKVVARVMIENAVVSAEFQLPFCQDTGTATIVGRRGTSS